MARLRLEGLKGFAKRLAALPLGELNRLRRVELAWLDLADIPAALAALPPLRELRVSETKLSSLPEALVANDRLEVLELRAGEMAPLPSLARMTRLRRLVGSSESITALPGSFRRTSSRSKSSARTSRPCLRPSAG